MPKAPARVRPKSGDALILVGTTKGAFLAHATGARRQWTISGPHFPGTSVYAMTLDQRKGRHRIWASTTSMHWGAVLQHSDDFGASWHVPTEAPVKFPADSGLTLKNIWQIEPAAANTPDTLYCGVEPSCLFESKDNGVTWAPVAGLLNHPHRPRWTPGGGGMCLHTIVRHPTNPQRMWVAMSTGGVYRTDDGGRTWSARNLGVRAEFLPEKQPEFGQCVHKIAVNPSRPDTLFLQNHWGLYRSDDGGDNWRDIAHGVPSDFGFPIVVDPNDPDRAYIIPLESDMFRCVPEAKLRVYRTANGGGSWQPLSKGLPQKDAFETVLRDGFGADPLSPTGLYFGTRSGRLYASRDAGKSWTLVAGGLPGIVCVKAFAVGGDGDGVAPRGARRTVSGKRASKPRAKARVKAGSKAKAKAKRGSATGGGRSRRAAGVRARK
jgi:photosystem II stability/assembly factor-like uncharacterized protein